MSATRRLKLLTALCPHSQRIPKHSATSQTSLPHSAQLQTSAHMHKGLPPVRDGDELSQPLQPADVRAFWDNPQPSKRPSAAEPMDISELHALLTTIIHKKARKGAVAMEQYTQRFCETYELLESTDRAKLLQMLAYKFCTPKGAALEAASKYIKGATESSDAAQSAYLARTLRDSLTPQYTELFDQINRLPGGFAFLVHMRADILEFIRSNRDDTAMRAMSDVLMKKLETWIIGTLDLKRITWNSPAYTIEKLGQYESVHAVKSWLDVKRRLGSGRRCFGFFHRSVPMEPLVFVWVALTDSITGNVQSILRDREPKTLREEAHAKCAIFYSINSQPGLAGVDLGNFLIKRVVGVLRADLPNISTFCTLSPLPRFRAWLDHWLTPKALEDPPNDINIPVYALEQLVSRVPGASTWTAALKHIIDSHGWTSSQDTLDAMEPVIRTLGAHYLMNVKRGNSRCAYDPVANFHLRNGACLHRVNWRGNTSYNGLRQSLELMCNYNYVLDRIEDNNERYVRDGAIAVSGDDPYIAQAQASSISAKL